MKATFVALLLGAVLLFSTAGCSANAATAQPSQPPAQSGTSREETPADPGTGTPAAPGPTGENREPGLMGQLVTVTETEVTLYLAQGGRPEGQPPGGGDGPDTEAPKNGDNPGGEGRSRSTALSQEATTYPLAQAVTVTDSGREPQSLSLEDLSQGDMIRLIWDESAGEVTAISLVNQPEDNHRGGTPASEEATGQ